MLSGEARFGWTHEIAKRKSDKYGGVRVPRLRRLSLTFRSVISATGATRANPGAVTPLDEAAVDE